MGGLNKKNTDSQNNLVERESLKTPSVSEQSYFPNTLECDSDQVGSEESRFLWDCVFCFLFLNEILL